MAYKKVLHRQTWVQVAPTPNAHAAGAGMACDLRNDLSRNPFAYQLVSAAVLNRYNFISKSWGFAVNPGLGGTFGAGAGAVFAPSFAAKGVVAAGCSTTSIVISTALPSAVGVNMLANRGGSGEYGYRIRITGLTAGGSGKTEERWITGNTGGTQPTLTLDTALTFTPAANDVYEILSGKVFMLSASTLAATIFRSFEVATNTLTSLANTNLAASIGTDFAANALDELYVPYDHVPGEGFVIDAANTYDASGVVKHCLVCTAKAASTITGQASGGDATVLQNEYRNFQIRIVEDTGTPTAVGQRRVIASHTAGASPVYTLSTAWTVQPSIGAKYVIEYPNLIILCSSGTASLYTYNYTDATITNSAGTALTANTWSTSYFATAANNMAAGCTLLPSFGIEPDTAKNARHSFVYRFRGGGSTALDLFDIAGGTTGAWTAAIVYDNPNPSFNVGSCGRYAPVCCEGRFGYINVYVASQISQMWRFDVKNRVLQNYVPTDWIQSGTAATGDRIATIAAIDGTEKKTVVLLVSHLSTIDQEIIVEV